MNQPVDRSAAEVIRFWFEELQPSQWWLSDPVLDDRIRGQFTTLHRAAAAGECWVWRRTPQGRLAEIVVLDQFSRNIHRGSAQAFACDAMALALAQEAVSSGADLELDASKRAFLYMPFMHSESAAIHGEALRLFAAAGLEANLDAEKRHKAIIDRFGRYPHRNAVLGRNSTEEELHFLTQPGSRF